MQQTTTNRRAAGTALLVLVLSLLSGACGSSGRDASRKPPPTHTPRPAAVSGQAASATDPPTQTQAPATAPTAVPAEEEPAPTATPEPRRVVRRPERPVPLAEPIKPKADRQPKKPKVAPTPSPRPKLVVPEPGPGYDLQTRIQGYTTYIYAARGGRRHVVAREETRFFPGLFAKYAVLSPDHRSVVYATSPVTTSDRMVLWLRGVDGSAKRPIASAEDELWVAAPVWSPDSRRIAYVRAQSPGDKPHLELWVVNADGSGNRKLFSHPSFRPEVFYGADQQPLAWTEYGDLRYEDLEAGRLYTVDGRTGEVSSQKQQLQAPKQRIPVVKTKFPIPIQSQNDPRWRYDLMKPRPNTMASFGCVMTSVSMSFNAHGVRTTPGRLNKEMGEFAANFEWGYAEYVSGWKLDVSNQQWQFDWYALDLSLSKGWPALVWLSDSWSTETSLLSHWVLVVGGGGREASGYRIYDPWDGSTWKTLGYYSSKGYDLTRVYAYAPVVPKKAKPAKKAEAANRSGRQP